MDDFQAATDRFLAWFKTAGGEFRDDLIVIKDLRTQDAGRGIVTIKDVPRDTMLFSIPREAIINVETSELPKKLPEVFGEPEEDGDEEKDSEPLDSWGSLILIMLYEHLQGEASKWKPYLDILPRTFDTPIFWTEDELKELRGTCLTEEKIGRKESDKILRSRILPVVTHHEDVFYTEGATQLSEDELLALAHRMGSTIMAYAFDLDNEKEDSDDEEEGWVEDRDGKSMLGMVPMADILNADAEFNAHVNHGESLEVTSLRSSLAAGTEVLNYYGPLPSSELLRRYGYVTPKHHRYDVVELPWGLVRSALGKELRLNEGELDKIEAGMDTEELEEYFIIERDSGEPDDEGRLTHPVNLHEISPELDEQLNAFFKAIKKVSPNKLADKRKRQETYKIVVTSALNAKTAQYCSTPQEDEALLRDGDLSKRNRMAIEVRLGERKLLDEAIALIRGPEGEDEEAEGERSKKKTRTTR